MQKYYFLSFLAFFIATTSIAQVSQKQKKQLTKSMMIGTHEKHHYAPPQSRIDSLPDYIKQLGHYKPTKALNPSHKLDSAIFLYAFADTVLNSLGKITYSFDQNEQLTEFVVSSYDSSNHRWEDRYKRSYTYNASGQMTQWRQFSWRSYYNKWEPTDGEDFIFNNNDSIIQHIYYRWRNPPNYLIKDYKQEYYYDSTNHCYMEKGYSWDYTHQKWYLKGRTLWFYDSLYQLSKKEIYSWRSSTNTWWGYGQHKYQYNTNGLLSQKIVTTGYTVNNVWKELSRSDYIYNSASQIDTIYEYTNDSLITNWKFNHIIVNTYDSIGNLTKSISQVNDSLGNYYDFSRYFYKYNASNYLILFSSEYISAITKKWVGWWRYRLYYDSNNNITSYWNFDYDTTNQVWDSLLYYSSDFDSSLNNQDIIIPRHEHLFYGSMQHDEFYPLMQQSNNALKHISLYTQDYLTGVYYKEYYYSFYYSAVDASISSLDNRSQINVYPNPTSTFLNIEIKKPNSELGKFTIYDIHGRKLFNFNTLSNKTIHINVSKLKPGLYFIKYKSSQQTSTRKFIIE